jgi:hypothetical protein
VPVAEGGGECDLANIRTLCLICHRKATAELRTRLRGRGSKVEPASVLGNGPEAGPRSAEVGSTSEIHEGTELLVQAATCS